MKLTPYIAVKVYSHLACNSSSKQHNERFYKDLEHLQKNTGAGHIKKAHDTTYPQTHQNKSDLVTDLTENPNNQEINLLLGGVTQASVNAIFIFRLTYPQTIHISNPNTQTNWETRSEESITTSNTQETETITKRFQLPSTENKTLKGIKEK